METLNAVLPILLYIAAIVLLVVLIIIGIRVLNMLDRVDKVLEDVEDKVSSVNNAITTMNKAVSGIANISDSVLFGITSAASKVFNKKRKEEEDKVYEKERIRKVRRRCCNRSWNRIIICSKEG